MYLTHNSFVFVIHRHKCFFRNMKRLALKCEKLEQDSSNRLVNSVKVKIFYNFKGKLTGLIQTRLLDSEGHKPTPNAIICKNL